MKVKSFIDSRLVYHDSASIHCHQHHHRRHHDHQEHDGHHSRRAQPQNPPRPQSQYHESYTWAMKAVQLLVPNNPPKVMIVIVIFMVILIMIMIMGNENYDNLYDT